MDFVHELIDKSSISETFNYSMNLHNREWENSSKFKNSSRRLVSFKRRERRKIVLEIRIISPFHVVKVDVYSA